MKARHLVLVATLACLIATGCAGGVPAAPGAAKRPAGSKPAVASPGPLATGGGPLGLEGLARVAVPADAPIATLTGKAKLLAPASLVSNNGGSLVSNNGGAIISDNGGGLIAGAKGAIISDNGGGIISNNSGAILSNNGGGVTTAGSNGTLIANNGGSLTGQASYGLAAAPAQVAGFALAEATITFHDATGAVLVDAQGQPLTATTDRTGAYTYSGPLPKGNVVARIKLNPAVGLGTLQAMVARDRQPNGGRGDGADAGPPLTLDLDTASTIGAAYVLGNFIAPQPNPQAVFDKLPRAANEKLQRELDVVRGYLVGAFAYDPQLLVEAADALRAREQAVDTTIDEVKALLLGQANIGAGRLATQVPLIEPASLALDADGRLLIAECFPGRLRAVGADGRIQTLIDASFGQLKRNFPGLRDLAVAPDGVRYVLSTRLAQIIRIAPDGTIAPYIGSGNIRHGGLAEVGDPLTTDVTPICFVRGPDGTLYFGEEHDLDKATKTAIPPRMLKLAPGGRLEALAQPASWSEGDVIGIALGPDGAVYAYYGSSTVAGTGEIWRVAPGPAVQLAAGLSPGPFGDLVVRPDGALIVSEQQGGRIVTIPAGGGAPTPLGGMPGLLGPGSLALAPDGTLYVADQATTLVHARRPDGRFEAVAGTQAAIQDGDVTTFAINGPGGMAFDAQGRLLIAEAGSGTVKRFDGKTLSVVVGSTRGDGGDGGPATQARFGALAGLAEDAGRLWVVDSGNGRLRAVGTDGLVTSRSGARDVSHDLEVGKPYDPQETRPRSMTGIALAPDGTPYFASGGSHQILRLRAGVMEVVAGRNQGDEAISEAGLIGGLLAGDETDPAKVNLRYPFAMAFDPLAAEPTLCVAEPGGLRVRKLSGLGAGQAAKVETYAGISLPEALAIAATFDPAKPPPSRNGWKATAAALFLPMGVGFDPQGNLYVAEAGTRSVSAIAPLFGGAFAFDASALPQAPARVLRIERATGTITIVCGPDGKWFTDPDAEDALVLPTGVAVAPDGRLVIIDSGANLVRILPAGSF